MTTDKGFIPYSKFKDGMKFWGVLSKKYEVTGIVSIEPSGSVYLCSDSSILDGSTTQERHGLPYSWVLLNSGYDYTDGKNNIFDLKLFDPVDQRKDTMSTPTKIASKFLDADTLTLIEAGYLTSELTVSETGRNALQAILFAANKKELIAMAREDIESLKK